MFHSLYLGKAPPLDLEANKENSLGTSKQSLLIEFPAVNTGQFKPLNPINSHKTWTVSVSGLVEKPAEFSIEAFQAFNILQQNRRIVFSEGLTYRADWEGFIVTELLHRVKPLPAARYLIQHNAAGQKECILLDDLLTHQALFCMRVNTLLLSETHGGPIRLLVFNQYAHKGLGQLTELVFSETPITGYSEALGLEASAKIQPGNYYASDCQEIKTVSEGHNGEIEAW
ncbi:MAG: molybdopterin-dependent oxidoreductase [Cyanobacteria bacterium P01_H01_bin.74]